MCILMGNSSKIISSCRSQTVYSGGDQGAPHVLETNLLYLWLPAKIPPGFRRTTVTIGLKKKQVKQIYKAPFITIRKITRFSPANSPNTHHILYCQVNDSDVQTEDEALLKQPRSNLRRVAEAARLRHCGNLQDPNHWWIHRLQHGGLWCRHSIEFSGNIKEAKEWRRKPFTKDNPSLCDHTKTLKKERKCNSESRGWR